MAVMPGEGKLRDTKSILQGLLDNKTEYTDHVCEILAEPMLRDFHGAYEKLRTSPDPASGLRVVRGTLLNKFQSWLVDVAGWNAAQIREAYQQVVKRSGCTYISDLVKGILITYVKIQMVSHGRGRDAGKIKLRVPSPENFLHACYISAARALWKRPYLFYHEVRSLERQQNLLVAEDLIRQAIKRTLRSFVPMDQLMSQLQSEDIPDPQTLSDDDDEDEDLEDEESSDLSESEPESESENSDSDNESEDKENESSENEGGKSDAAAESESEESEESGELYELEEPQKAALPENVPVNPIEPLKEYIVQNTIDTTQSDTDGEEDEDEEEDEEGEEKALSESEDSIDENLDLNMGDETTTLHEVQSEPNRQDIEEILSESANAEELSSIKSIAVELKGGIAMGLVPEIKHKHEETETEQQTADENADATANDGELTNKVVPLGNMLVNRTKLHRPKLHKSMLLRQSLKRADDTFF